MASAASNACLLPATNQQQPQAVAVQAAKPFLKWAGGKTQLLKALLPYFPKHYNRYYEPFVGGGAVFFALQPRKATLSDINQDLIYTYQAIQQNVQGVMRSLAQHAMTPEHFYKVRAQNPEKLSILQRAARTIFLNRACFNGLYRVNANGQFNVPYGRHRSNKVIHKEILLAAAQALRHVQLYCRNVFALGRSARCGDLVYFDPPYHPLSATSSFRNYAQGGFTVEQQTKLADFARRLAERGIHVVLSNSDTPLIHQLYRDFHIERVLARRSINSKGQQRGTIYEVIITTNKPVNALQTCLA